MLEVIAILACAVALKGAVFIPYLLQARRKPLVTDDIDHAWNTAWVMPDMDAYMRSQHDTIRKIAAGTAVPELRLTNGYGLVSSIGSDGVLRTERHMRSPDANASPEPPGNVIPIWKHGGK